MSSTSARALQPPTEPGETASSTKTNWLFFFIGIMVFTIAMMLVSFPVGLYTVFGTNLSANYSASTPVYSVGFDFLLATVQVPLFSNFGVVFLGLSVIYFVFFLLAARQGAGILRALRESVHGGYDSLFTNPLAATLVLLGAVSFGTILIDTFQTNTGISTGSLTGDPFLLLMNFTLAPLTEETTFRLILIGLPVLVLSFIMFRDLRPIAAAKALWRPSSAWDVDEDAETEAVIIRSFKETGPTIFPDSGSDSLKVRAIKPVVYAFLLLSSLIFGYAHYASGIGWGPGKVSEAALAGLFLGYLYIKYGFQTSVLLHWSVNYVGSIFSFLGQAVYGVPWTSSTGSFLDVVPTVTIVYLLGVPSTLIVLNELVKGVIGGRRRIFSRPPAR